MDPLGVIDCLIGLGLASAQQPWKPLVISLFIHRFECSATQLIIEDFQQHLLQSNPVDIIATYGPVIPS